MTKPSLLAAPALAFLALAACNNKPIVVDGNPDPMKNAVAAAPPVQLPPAISASVLFRCKDQSVVTVDFLMGNMPARLHPTTAGEPVHLTAAMGGGPYTGPNGYSLTGDEKKIEWKDKDKPELSCHV